MLKEKKISKKHFNFNVELTVKQHDEEKKIH